MFGYARDEVLGQPLAPLIIPETMRAAHNNGMQQFTQQGTGPMVDKRMEVEALHRTGQTHSDRNLAVGDGQGDHFVAHAFLRDISERKAAERALALSEAKLRGVTDNLPALVSPWTQERFTFVNSAVREWWGMEPDALLGRTMREVVGETVYPIAQAPLKRALAGGGWSSTQRQIHGGCAMCNIYVPDMDSEGTTRGVFTLSINITELKTVERKLALLARVDPLTQLANRLGVQRKPAANPGPCPPQRTALALMYLDIDHFKAINDSLGHAAGDEVLEEFARRLQAGVRSTDTVARLAGDEFVAVLENVAETSVAADVAQKIVDQVARPLFWWEGSLCISRPASASFLRPGRAADDAGRTHGPRRRRALPRQSRRPQPVSVLVADYAPDHLEAGNWANNIAASAWYCAKGQKAMETVSCSATHPRTEASAAGRPAAWVPRPWPCRACRRPCRPPAGPQS